MQVKLRSKYCSKEKENMVESEQCTIAVALKVLTGPGLAASALPGIRLEVQILRPYLRPPK